MRRRDILTGVAACLLAPASTRAAGSLRLAAIDWAMFETSVAIGVMPVAATELIQFRKDAIDPAIPHEVVDLGLRGSPNFELLHLLEPDLILISPFYTRHEGLLRNIAPVLSLPFYIRGEPPFEKALQAVSALGVRLGRNQQADDVRAQAVSQLDSMRKALLRFADRPFYLVNIGDARHVRVFGSDSMFGDVLGRLGLVNAWNDRSRFTFAAPVPIENLAAVPDARIVVVSEIPVEARQGLRGSRIWNALHPVREGRVLMLDNVNPYGGLIAGMRFANLLARRLERGEGVHR